MSSGLHSGLSAVARLVAALADQATLAAPPSPAPTAATADTVTADTRAAASVALALSSAVRSLASAHLSFEQAAAIAEYSALLGSSSSRVRAPASSGGVGRQLASLVPLQPSSEEIARGKLHLLLVLPSTHEDARSLVAGRTDACLCVVERTRDLSSLRALCERVRALVRAEHATGTQAPMDDAAFPCIARVLWHLSHAALCARAQGGGGGGASSGSAGGSGGPAAVLAVETGQWATAERAEARLCFMSGLGKARRPVSRWACARGGARQGCEAGSVRWRSRAQPRPRALTLVLTLTQDFLLGLPPASHRLVRAERVLAALRDTVAMVSTLGGGYFLVKDIGKAVQLARQQAWLAWRLGDGALWRASHLHLIYIAIQVGAWDRGAALIAQLTPGARDAGDERFLAMLSAATGYLERTRAWAEQGKLAGEDAHRQALAVVGQEVLRELVVLDFEEGEEGEGSLRALGV